MHSPAASTGAAPTLPMPRSIGAVNWIGLATLIRREVRRFLKVWVQTVGAPVITTLLYFSVFALAMGGVVRSAGGVPYLQFLAPGLVMMSIAQNAFANTSSSLISSKMQGNIVDLLMTPLSPGEFALGYVVGGVVRGIAVGLVTVATVWLFVPMPVVAPFFVLFHALAAAIMMSLLGLIGGIWADKFDHMAVIGNFVVTPLTFLSGTFYSLQAVPPFFQAIAHVNPVYYFIDGFRYGFIGRSDSSLAVGIWVMIGVNAALWVLAYAMLKRGYKLKA
jgi:ABC-2 type transport system permease protein